MEKNSILSLFEKKDTKTEDIVDKVTENPDLLPEFFAGISSIDPKIKFGSAKVLRIISERNPEMLYSKMEFFVNLLDSENNIH